MLEPSHARMLLFVCGVISAFIAIGGLVFTVIWSRKEARSVRRVAAADTLEIQP
jgi:succinate dehydrogenase hydrophobic anchor subunit